MWRARRPIPLRETLIRNVDIAFSRGWKRSQNSATRTWSNADSERIKRDLASLFASTARRELEVEGGYEIVTEPGQDVLEIRPSIIDLYINAPGLSRTEPGIVRRYTTDAGRMTLVAELRDSISGELLARAYDKREDMRSTYNNIYHKERHSRVLSSLIGIRNASDTKTVTIDA